MERKQEKTSKPNKTLAGRADDEADDKEKKFVWYRSKGALIFLLLGTLFGWYHVLTCSSEFGGCDRLFQKRVIAYGGPICILVYFFLRITKPKKESP